MIEGKLVDLVPFEDDFATYFETWMNEDPWFRARFWERRQPHPEDVTKKFIEKMEKDEHAALIGFQTKGADPVGGLIYDHEWSRVRKVDVTWFVGDQRYEGTDEELDGLLMLARYCFEVRNMHRLDASALAFDANRIAMLTRAGFQHEGTLRQHIRWDGAYVDVEVYGLLEQEWPGYEAITAALDLKPGNLEPKPKPEKTEEPEAGNK